MNCSCNGIRAGVSEFQPGEYINENDYTDNVINTRHFLNVYKVDLGVLCTTEWNEYKNDNNSAGSLSIIQTIIYSVRRDYRKCQFNTTEG